MIYYFNDDVDGKGNHEVHTNSCSFLPGVANRTLIGSYPDCYAAIQAVKASFPYKKV